MHFSLLNKFYQKISVSLLGLFNLRHCFVKHAFCIFNTVKSVLLFLFFRISLPWWVDWCTLFISCFFSKSLFAFLWRIHFQFKLIFCFTKARVSFGKAIFIFGVDVRLFNNNLLSFWSRWSKFNIDSSCQRGHKCDYKQSWFH